VPKKTNKFQFHCLIPVILGTQEADFRRLSSKPAPAKLFIRPYLKRTDQKKGLEDYLKW
jgi:hypothetical protein